MAVSHQQFIDKWNNRYLEFPGTGSALYQCLDLARYYIQEVWGLNPYVIPRAVNAKSAYNAARTNNKIVKIANTPTGVPRQGDLIFWGFYPGITGLDGHVSVFHKGDVMNIISFEQNYPKYTPCHLQRHSYRGVMGWIRKA